MTTDTARVHAEDPASALPRGTRLGEFELLRVMGIGGFGIVYLAFDHTLEREVAVKEYMPASLAGRTQTLHVSVRSQSDAETFALGLRSFVNEARLLARFDHLSLLKVLRFWEANGTAYMAMPVLRGQTLRALRLSSMQPPDEVWLRALLEPLLGAIERLHSEGVYHRDIAPDNIQIEPDGRPVLLDFGAARRVISDTSQNLTPILKPAYAPIEQDAEVGSVRQGPWTDLYALGATLYFLLLGHPPSPATARAVHDSLAPLASSGLAGYSDGFLNIVDWMLATRPSDRPQSVAALRAVLEGRVAAPVRRQEQPAAHSAWDQTQALARPSGPAPASAGGSAGADDEMATVVAPMGGSRAQPLAAAARVNSAPLAGASTAKPGSPGGRQMLLPWMGGLAALLLVAVVAAFFLWPGRNAVAPTGVSSAPPAADPQGAGAAGKTPLPAAAPAMPAPMADLPRDAPAPAPTAPVAAAVPAAVGPAPTVPAARPAASAARAPVLAGRSQPTAEPTQRTATQATPANANANTNTNANPPAPAPGSTAGNATGPPPAPAGADAAAATRPARPGIVPAAPAAAEPAAPLATGPEATCGAKNAVLYFVCMERECLRRSLAAHPDCLKWRNSLPKDN